MPKPDAPTRICFETSLAAESVSKSGFTDVSLITAEAEALGHGVWVDTKGVEQLAAMLVGKSLPSYLTHEGAQFADRLGTEVGYFSGIGLDTEAGKLRGNFKFFNSFKEHEAASFDKLTELAETMPEQFGVSVVFSGTMVWTFEDGTETPATERTAPEGALRGIPSVRFRSIESADFVKSPAVNADGLFDQNHQPAAQPVDGEISNNMENTFSQDDLDARLETLTADHTVALSELEKGHAVALADLAEEHQVALAEITEKLDAHEAAIAEAEADLVKIEAELATAKSEAAELLGVPAAEVLNEGDEGEASPAPAEGANANDKWNQYSALLVEDHDKAEAFRALHLS